MRDRMSLGFLLWALIRMRPMPTILSFSLLFFLVSASSQIANAQQPKKVPRIGFLGATSPSIESTRIEAFRQGMRELGYVEGKNIAIEWRWAEGKFDRLPDLATELVRLGVDVIVTGGSTSSGAAKRVTTTIPIVMAQVNDPVGSGVVASLAHPGGNITGLSTLVPEISGKRLEMLKEVIPKLSRVAVFGDSTAPGNAQSLRETELAAKSFKIQLQYLDILGPKQIDIAFREAAKERADAVLVLAAPVLISQRKHITELAAKNRLAAIYPQKEYVEDGGLMSYGVSIVDLYRRAATFVDKILKGAKPKDLPVEQPTKFEFIINLKTAKQIGLTIPPNVLARADKVIR
jgi:putative tryptophan/tyrosine transport system substrate-binding protein